MPRAASTRLATASSDRPSSGNSPTAAPRGHVLVVDDYPAARESMALALRAAGHSVDCVSSGAEALGKAGAESHRSYDVILTDLQMPGMDGLELIRQLASRRDAAQVVVVTAHASIPTAVEAMRLGAFHYLEKRFDLAELEQMIERAIEHGQQLARSARLGEAAPAAGRLSDRTVERPQLIGASPAIVRLRRQIEQAAPLAGTVLIQGESGSGKEVVARLLHALGPRSSRALIDVNCAALAPQLTESELFGHVAGAYTGASSARPGRFELAHQGVLLLDEIGELELPLQAKLLRVLQEGTFQRVGCNQTRRVDVHVLACTNRRLSEEAAAGRFREDLYYRLNVVPLEVPPLRDRREDIPALIAHLLAVAGTPGDVDRLFDSAARQLLLEHAWPGNVRELQNIVTRARIFAGDAPLSADALRPWLLPAPSTVRAEEMPVGLSLREMERRLIEATLARFQGHRQKTADALGIGVRTLQIKLKEYGVR